MVVFGDHQGGELVEALDGVATGNAADDRASLLFGHAARRRA